MEKIIDEKKQGETLILDSKKENTRNLFIESYGCAMNFSDSEIVASILDKEGFNTTQRLEDARHRICFNVGRCSLLTNGEGDGLYICDALYDHALNMAVSKPIFNPGYIRDISCGFFYRLFQF